MIPETSTKKPSLIIEKVSSHFGQSAFSLKKCIQGCIQGLNINDQSRKNILYIQKLHSAVFLDSLIGFKFELQKSNCHALIGMMFEKSDW